MNDQLSATIIPFPVRRTQSQPTVPVEADFVPQALKTIPPVAPTAATAKSGELSASAQRLSLALAGLSTALADQRDATQRWKSALEDLAAKMRTLGDLSTLKITPNQKTGS
ncbi:hypothetical protein [Acidisphaera sp. L21]|jgi:hypothetical protein|uniref:hypothetical protein n=1 Tax=Acidisphaera sp. L21 TaxID=1641851 RepID=UPI00131D8310|nr:hypothetical protein [Acidisphaera sp. L21]